jgi:hypothetical protein
MSKVLRRYNPVDGLEFLSERLYGSLATASQRFPAHIDDDWHMVGDPGEPPFGEAGYATSWQNWSGDAAPVSWVKDSERFVHVRGMAAAKETIGASGTIFVIPEHAAVAGVHRKEAYAIDASSGAVVTRLVQVQPSQGLGSYVSLFGNDNVSRISLDGLWWRAVYDPWRLIDDPDLSNLFSPRLKSPFVADLGTYGDEWPRFQLEDEQIVSLKGLVWSGQAPPPGGDGNTHPGTAVAAGALMFTLPVGYRPAGQLTFRSRQLADNPDGYLERDEYHVYADGRVVLGHDLPRLTATGKNTYDVTLVSTYNGGRFYRKQGI